MHFTFKNTLRLTGLLAAFAWAVSPQAAYAQATYNYVGNPFVYFSCGPNPSGPGDIGCLNDPAPANPDTSYLATDKVTATLTLDSALPANFPYQDVRGLSGFHLSLNDGRHTVTTLDAAGGFFAEVSTDNLGHINFWRFVLNTGLPANGGISTYHWVNPSGDTFTQDMGTLQCCSPTIVGNFAQIINAPGTFNGGSAPNPVTLTTNLLTTLSNGSLGLTGGQANSLTDKLTNALSSIQGGQLKQAINQLQAFINAVQSYAKNGKITPQTAATLIDSANAIIALISF